ncbi:hypothetical protein MMC10_007619 [Thelotrema lepadinum]|nr:hypothetical protein [Thelotrema lepadinum]
MADLQSCVHYETLLLNLDKIDKWVSEKRKAKWQERRKVTKQLEHMLKDHSGASANDVLETTLQAMDSISQDLLSILDSHLPNFRIVLREHRAKAAFKALKNKTHFFKLHLQCDTNILKLQLQA